MCSRHDRCGTHECGDDGPDEVVCACRQGPDCCKDDRTAGRTKGVRHTCPGLSKGRGEARCFAPKGTQGKGRDRRKSKAEG